MREDADLLVGFRDSDDAGVYRINADQALVTTVDLITPPVDDPVVFGRIAAANSLSDIYAMGGRPVTCLNLVCFPTNRLDDSVLLRIVEGAQQTIEEAGAVLIGGHSVEDQEPKFGLSVTGLVHPDGFWANRGARPGDRLILTKAIGSGVLFNANLRGAVSDEAMRACIDQACRLNRFAAGVLAGFEVHAATDVTGFGLAGHAREMALASGVTIRIDAGRVPLLDEADGLYDRGFTTGVNAENLRQLDVDCVFHSLPQSLGSLMVDPQTNGGLLVSVPPDQAGPVIRSLVDAGDTSAAIIGEVIGFDGRMRVEIAGPG